MNKPHIYRLRTAQGDCWTVGWPGEATAYAFIGFRAAATFCVHREKQ